MSAADQVPKGTQQEDLVIAPPNEPEITTDDTKGRTSEAVMPVSKDNYLMESK